MEDQVLRQKYIDLCKKMGIHEGNTFGYVAVTAAYNDGETWLDTVLAIIYDNYQRLKKALQSFPEIVLSPLEGTYLAWLDLRNIVAPENLRSFIQKETGLAVNYGDWFFQPDKEDAHIRINLATPTENMEKAFTKLTAAFEKKI
jgi:cystathionine beta-lyase